MRITKLEHSGLLLERGSSKLIIDPVEISSALPDLTNLAALIITHKHGDHLNPEIINRIRESNPEIKIFTCGDTASDIPGSTIVTDGERVEIADFTLQFFGRNHAAILEGITPCENIGVVVNDLFATPADSFDTPPIKPKVLAVPISAPWLKLSESLDYIKSVRPETVIPVHDALLSDFGRQICGNWLKTTSEELNIVYSPLAPSESVIVD